jgi:hypothetical protein
MGLGNPPAVRVLISGSVPDPAKNLTRFVLAGLLPGLHINPRFFGQVVSGPQFHIMVPATWAPI